MTDLSCLLAGLTRLLLPLLLLLFWHRKTGARLYPAPVALIVCLPVFIIAGGIRSGFGQEDFVLFHLQTGLLYGIFEEGGKYLALRFLLESYDSRKDAVTYGLGHTMFEDIGAGLSCFGLIGSGTAAPDIFAVNLLTALFGAAGTVSLTVLILYGIRTGKSRLTLPAAMLLHAVGNSLNGIFSFSKVFRIVFGLLETVLTCWIAYRCWRALDEPDGE